MTFTVKLHQLWLPKLYRKTKYVSNSLGFIDLT